MLVHICCSVDSCYFLKRLREAMPDEKIIGFFYNPNIHPYGEYKLRLLDVKRDCQKQGIRLIEGEYGLKDWLESVRGFECEKERGKRCEICFEQRLDVSAKKAKEIGENSITTTLFMSPKKSFEQLSIAAEKISQKREIEVLCFDFRKRGGTQEQFALAKEKRLYRQNYCGCIYALLDQREAQKRLCSELLSPVGKEILPSSIEERLETFEKVDIYEKNRVDFTLKREKFQNYRFLWGRILDESNTVLPSWFLGVYHGDSEVIIKSIDSGYGFAENMLFIELWRFNQIAGYIYKSVKELIFNPPTNEEQKNICMKFPDYPLIIVIENIEKKTYNIEARSIFYEDVREVLAIL
ncbi:MAG: epoxyqueuosine reductase QueH [Campylobacteraceae bacterium]|jgi:predicted adenine nucleotide alpha hydrolase (AANH) superfamily ATPase|nr:epoxyqueuosine reductase QueH [Campylobacteraceae bacterium]